MTAGEGAGAVLLAGAIVPTRLPSPLSVMVRPSNWSAAAAGHDRRTCEDRR
jgi:hypothetical protein